MSALKKAASSAARAISHNRRRCTLGSEFVPLSDCSVALDLRRMPRSVSNEMERGDSFAHLPLSAFELQRGISDVLSRVTDVAASQRLDARGASG